MWKLMTHMILKEMRTTMRERNQLVALVGGVVVLCLSLGFAGYQAAQDFRQTHHGPRPAFMAEPHFINGVRWVTIGAGAGAGLFFALGYLISATLATFVGEKESRTLEILLVAPISDSRLFALKCLSVIVPMTAIGYVFVLAGVVIVHTLMRPLLAMIDVNIALYAMVFSPPVTMLVVLTMVGLGAAISSKADTTKGAGQVFGAAFMVIFFGLGYGVPLLVMFMGWGDAVGAVIKKWLLWPFGMQYAMVIALLAVPALTSLAVGRALFRRDKLLG